MKLKKEDLILYAVTDRSWLKHESLAEQVEQALKGGATMVQLREKELPESEAEKEAWQIKKLCAQYKVPFIIDDNVALAKKVDADGVHIGQNDMAAIEARAVLGADKIVGVTAKTVEQAKNAQEAGADYLGSGAVFYTGTKADAKNLDHDVLQKICESVSIPVVAIGGITAENVTKLKGRKIDGVAGVSGIFANPDIEAGTRRLKELVLSVL